MKKNSILVIITITILSLIFMLTKNIKEGTKDLTNKDEVTSVKKTSEIIKRENVIKKEEKDDSITYKIENNTDFIIINNSLEDFLKNEQNLNKKLNYEITNIKLDNEEYTLKYNDIPFDYMKCMEINNKYNTFYLNDTKLYSQNNEACYLTQAKFIKIIDNKYVALIFAGESNNVMFVYDSHLKLIDTLEAINIEYNNSNIEFINYEEEDPKYLLNTYKYEIKFERPVKTKIEDGTESYCNMESGEGICED